MVGCSGPRIGQVMAGCSGPRIDSSGSRGSRIVYKPIGGLFWVKG